MISDPTDLLEVREIVIPILKNSLVVYARLKRHILSFELSADECDILDRGFSKRLGTKATLFRPI